ncbi:MAG: translation elongation factor Ts [Candidatus Harrisonbacteria bacterium CG10_big_fil_rev_8_21_14_0_10_49_15]|uniref:Elongation factor Ts n=1 Tax=Candidatus Harrisonbacteria bacterium CG10_big_fil_rev_8_21_14_0_10_49_15 TaxID=1974587 RepID=A0A2H0UMT3_9BACT|nr:MAG: translation elongation factor Ts [Candidatus Harrisonbacteria bacterium CG10_big_fil_rev_8_21_14_0_10_49_15]
MSAQDVAKLRQETGAGILDCKKALEEAAGDFAKAREIITVKGLLKADKKGDRETGAGHLEAYIHGGRVGVLLEIRAETDFVTRNESFKDCARNVAMHIAAVAPESIEDLLTQPYVREPDINVEAYIKNTIAKVGENIQVSRFTRYEV